MNLHFVADFFHRDGGPWANGGAELDNETFLRWAEAQGHPFTLHRSQELRARDIVPENRYLVANCRGLSISAEAALVKHKNYVFWEHDHKYCMVPDRNPTSYPDHIVPPDALGHLDLYQAARKVFGFSAHHADIVSKNTGVEVQPLGTCFWTDEQFDLIDRLATQKAKRPYRPEWVILQSPNPIKNTAGTIQWAKEMNLPYALIPPMGHSDFIIELSKYFGMLFAPLVIESFSRVVAEGKMLGLNVLMTPNMVGAEKELQEILVLGHAQAIVAQSHSLRAKLRSHRDIGMTNILQATLED